MSDTQLTACMPRHIGPKILPHSSIFNQLLLLARKHGRIAIRDVTYHIQADYTQFLSDVINLRNVMHDKLDYKTQTDLKHGRDVFINLLAPASYEFAVAFLAIVAIGAAAVPLSPAAPINEAAYIAQTSSSVAVLTASSLVGRADDMVAYMNKSGRSYQSISISQYASQPEIAHHEIVISTDHYLDEQGPGMMIFTSGTTGPPKGAIRTRSSLYGGSRGISDWYGLSENDVVLHGLPVHHATGIGVTLLPFLLSGACIEFSSDGFDAAKVWNRWRARNVTVFSGVPTMYARLWAYFETHISKLPIQECESYIDAVKSLRILMSGSAALPQPLQQKWMKLLGSGRRILERYGSTESGFVFGVGPEDLGVPDGSVGKLYPGLDVRLSNGNEGEILVKSPWMFSRYIGNPTATAHSFDKDGYFKTGDIARREGDYFFILGRASVDILKSGGYKISALDVERALLGLDQISEAVVVGVEDEEFGQRVAAAVVLKDQAAKITINDIRGSLRPFLAGYKMPTLLRVVKEFPKNSSGKVSKKQLGPELFPKSGHRDVQIWSQKSAKL